MYPLNPDLLRALSRWSGVGILYKFFDPTRLVATTPAFIASPSCSEGLPAQTPASI